MEKNFNAKKTVNLVVNVILWIFVAFCVFVTIVAVSANANAKNVPTVGGKCYLYVQSGSMDAEKPAGVPENKPSGFSKGTMIIGKYISTDDAAIDALEVGDIVTYEWDINGDGVVSPGEYNTHRITAIRRNDNGNVISVTTMGDNEEYSHGFSESVDRSRLIAVYTGTKIAGLGSVMTFLSSRLGFGLCILLPLIAFFVYQLVVFIRTLLSVKNSGKKMISAADEELIRQKAVEEYLKKQAEAANDKGTTPENAPQEENKDGKD